MDKKTGLLPLLFFGGGTTETGGFHVIGEWGGAALHQAGGHKMSYSSPLIGPVAAAVASLAWAVSVYFIEREKYRAQVELARLEVEAKKQGFPVSQPGGSRSTPKLSSLARRKPTTAECQSNFR